MLIEGVTKAPCPMCVGKAAGKEKTVFVIKHEGYNGLLCSDHLEVLAAQLKAKPQTIPMAHAAK